VNFVAIRTTFPERLMFKDKRPTLIFMAFKTGFIHTDQTGPCPRAGIRAMQIVAIGTGHLSFQNRMPIRKTEFSFFIQVTSKTHLRFLAGIDHCPFTATIFSVHTTRAMTYFTSLGYP
jgi:hypothetical protein